MWPADGAVVTWSGVRTCSRRWARPPGTWAVAGRTPGVRRVVGMCGAPSLLASLAGGLPAGACFQAGAMDGRWSGGHTPVSAAASNLNN
jgi:hypothetical protein